MFYQRLKNKKSNMEREETKIIEKQIVNMKIDSYKADITNERGDDKDLYEKESRKKRFVLLEMTKTDSTSEKEVSDDKMRLTTMSPEDWLAKFYSGDPVFKNKGNMKETKTEVTLKFEDLVFRPGTSNNSDIDHGNTLRPKLDVAANQTPDKQLLTNSTEGKHVLTTPMEAKHVLTNSMEGKHGLTNPMEGNHVLTNPVQDNHVKSGSKDSQRWMPVFFPSQRQEK